MYTNPKFGTRDMRVKNVKELDAILAAFIGDKSSAEVLDTLEAQAFPPPRFALPQRPYPIPAFWRAKKLSLWSIRSTAPRITCTAWESLSVFRTQRPALTGLRLHWASTTTNSTKNGWATPPIRFGNLKLRESYESVGGIRFVPAAGRLFVSGRSSRAFVRGRLPPVLSRELSFCRSQPSELFEREFFGARAFNIFNEITADEARRFRAVVLSRTSEQEFKLFLYLSELARGGRISQNTQVYLFNLLQTEGGSTKAYGVAQVNLLAQSAKDWSGKDFGEADLRAAIEDANQARQTLAEGLKLRSQWQCATGCAVMDLVNAYYSLEPREFCEFAKTWSAAWKAKPTFSAPRILLLGDIPAGGALHSFIEGETAVVSVEDSWLGERAAVQPMNAEQDIMAAIAGITCMALSRPVVTRDGRVKHGSTPCRTTLTEPYSFTVIAMPSRAGTAPGRRAC